ncbi:MAG: hypothetical protein Q8P15_00655 [Nanoarchaeota archaeon]|nr:hypothetical protein [Nanoarchaeota archaeon]
MITFNDIYEAERKERFSEQLQKLPKTFIMDVANYFREKKEMAAKEDDDFSEVIVRTKKQLENAVTLFRALIRVRRKKILNLVSVAAETGISKQDFENMLTFEKILFEDLMKCIDSSDRQLDETLNGKKEEKDDGLVIFKENVGEFVSFEGEKLGPYEKGQSVKLPKDIAKILIEDGKAEKFVKVEEG